MKVAEECDDPNAFTDVVDLNMTCEETKLLQKLF